MFVPGKFGDLDCIFVITLVWTPSFGFPLPSGCCFIECVRYKCRNPLFSLFPGYIQGTSMVYPGISRYIQVNRGRSRVSIYFRGGRSLYIPGGK